MRLFALAIVLLASSPVRANPAAAKTLFDEATALFDAGDYVHACPKLETSYKLSPLSATRGLLASCYENIDRLASAWTAHRDVAAMAEREGAMDRARFARERIAELEPKLARLTIDVTAIASAPNVVMTIDGVRYPLNAFATAIPFDAGEHVVEVMATERHAWKHEINIKNGDTPKVAIPALVEDPTRRLAVEARREKQRRKSSRLRIAGLATAGVGVIGIGLGIKLGLQAQSLSDELSAHSMGPWTDDEKRKLADGERANTRMGYAYVAGGILVATGAVLFVIGVRTRVGVDVTAESTSVVARGRF